MFQNTSTTESEREGRSTHSYKANSGMEQSLTVTLCMRGSQNARLNYKHVFFFFSYLSFHFSCSVIHLARSGKQTQRTNSLLEGSKDSSLDYKTLFASCCQIRWNEGVCIASTNKASKPRWQNTPGSFSALLPPAEWQHHPSVVGFILNTLRHERCVVKVKERLRSWLKDTKVDS